MAVAHSRAGRAPGRGLSYCSATAAAAGHGMCEMLQAAYQVVDQAVQCCASCTCSVSNQQLTEEGFKGQ